MRSFYVSMGALDAMVAGDWLRLARGWLLEAVARLMVADGVCSRPVGAGLMPGRGRGGWAVHAAAHQRPGRVTVQSWQGSRAHGWLWWWRWCCACDGNRAWRRRWAGRSCATAARAAASCRARGAPQAVCMVADAGVRAVYRMAALGTCSGRWRRRGRAGDAAGGGPDVYAACARAERSRGAFGGGEKPSCAGGDPAQVSRVLCGGAVVGRGRAPRAGGAVGGHAAPHRASGAGAQSQRAQRRRSEGGDALGDVWSSMCVAWFLYF